MENQLCGGDERKKQQCLSVKSADPQHRSRRISHAPALIGNHCFDHQAAAKHRKESKADRKILSMLLASLDIWNETNIYTACLSLTELVMLSILFASPSRLCASSRETSAAPSPDACGIGSRTPARRKHPELPSHKLSSSAGSAARDSRQVIHREKKRTWFTIMNAC